MKSIIAIVQWNNKGLVAVPILIKVSRLQVPTLSSPLDMKDKFNEYLETLRKKPPAAKEPSSKLDDN